MNFLSSLLMLLGAKAATPAGPASAPVEPPAAAAPVQTPQPVTPTIVQTAPPSDPTVLEGRKRPGEHPAYPDEIVQTNPGAIQAPPPEAFPKDQIPVPDRWRLAADLKLVNPRYFDPYNQNTLKGDRPLPGTKDWFLEVNAVSDTLISPFSI